MKTPLVFRAAFTAAVLGGLAACGGPKTPPSDIGNACSIVRERGDWYSAAKNAARKWNAPAPVILAIIRQESRFVADARPPRKYVLGVIPRGRPSSAFGFPQALDGTWEEYKRSRNAAGASRENFADAADFVGWYMNNTRKRLGIPAHDARNQYLAYHEGHTGYRRGNWRNKQFLLRASAEVERISREYDAQLRSCDATYV